jgi:diketogulonate reductase-like aldo/keto reductase
MKFDGPASTLLRTVGRPPFVYGTAWKKDQTTRLVKEAVLAGFTAIDTAAQPKHYREDLVGDALRELYESGKLKREDLFVSSTTISPYCWHCDTRHVHFMLRRGGLSLKFEHFDTYLNLIPIRPSEFPSSRPA